MLPSKNKIEVHDKEYVEYIKEFWKPFNNSISVIFSDWKCDFWIRWLFYTGMEQGVGKFRNIKYNYYEDNDWIHHYIVNLPDGKVLDFSWKTSDEAYGKFDTYDLHDIWRAPDGTLWKYNKFLYDVLLWNFHWCYLKKLEPLKWMGMGTYNPNNKKNWHKKRFKRGR